VFRIPTIIVTLSFRRIRPLPQRLRSELPPQFLPKPFSRGEPACIGPSKNPIPLYRVGFFLPGTYRSRNRYSSLKQLSGPLEMHSCGPRSSPTRTSQPRYLNVLAPGKPLSRFLSPFPRRSSIPWHAATPPAPSTPSTQSMDTKLRLARHRPSKSLYSSRPTASMICRRAPVFPKAGGVARCP
jgi:hypothetical protein